MDTLIYLGIGITLGIIAFIIQARRVAHKDAQHREEMVRQWDELCAQLDKEHEELMERLKRNRHPSQDDAKGQNHDR
jgi:uncharacterized membrane-anchored protein YhcB (DUF1043 family)